MYIYVTNSFPHSLTDIWLSDDVSVALFVDRFGHFLCFCYLEFDMEAISDGCMSEMLGIGGGLKLQGYLTF